MMNKIKINVLIDGVKHEMSVDPSKEALYRRAAKLVDEKLLSLKSEWKFGGRGDYMTFVAYILAFEILEKQSEEISTDMNSKLNDILRKLNVE